MNTPTLLGPTARPMVCLGGTNAWRQRTIKGIVCSFQWLDLSDSIINGEKGEKTNACMTLFNPRRKMDNGAYVIPQQNAYLFGTASGNPTTHLITSGWAAAQTLGFDLRDKMAIRSIIDIIIEGLPDLILMPSEPPNSTEILVKQAVMGIEASASINGVKIHEELL